MNVNVKKNKRQVKVQDSSINVLSMEEMKSRIATVEKDMNSYTWRELETNGKFAKNDKLSFIHYGAVPFAAVFFCINSHFTAF